MLLMSEESKVFLQNHLPDLLEEETVNGILDPLGEFIDEKGFAPPDYYDYNDLGREAQKVYDDIYYQNCQKQN